LTPERHDKIVALVAEGNYFKTAARCAGIEPATFFNWMKWGAAAKSGRYFDFFCAVTQAEAEAEAWHVANIKKQAPADWRASIEFLKRRHREDWAQALRDVEKIQSDRVEVTINVNADSGKLDSEIASRVGIIERIRAAGRNGNGAHRPPGVGGIPEAPGGDVGQDSDQTHSGGK
jgi:hypothetical protein